MKTIPHYRVHQETGIVLRIPCVNCGHANTLHRPKRQRHACNGGDAEPCKCTEYIADETAPVSTEPAHGLSNYRNNLRYEEHSRSADRCAP